MFMLPPTGTGVGRRNFGEAPRTATTLLSLARPLRPLKPKLIALVWVKLKSNRIKCCYSYAYQATI
eukprot:scaffold6760_cov133-Skeletonema_menzelii.AAC.1